MGPTPRRSPPDAIAATAPLRRRPKNLKLKLGDYLEYTPATGEPKNGAPGKPRATRVERAPRPKKVARGVLSLAFYFQPSPVPRLRLIRGRAPRPFWSLR